ncbi:ShlB/FhaC/HecB family hemolysin secretion/activation protein [Haemophilus haemoglobinophilus]|nr:ShlB/FhaC/HecB family hemolysin secretion/activation protein [Canicola haemoglobinophilus]
MKLSKFLFFNIISLASIYSLAHNQKEQFRQLNQLDANQQLHQIQQQTEKQKQLNNQADIRLEIEGEKIRSFPSNETPCFDIHKITLLDYAPNNQFTSSEFKLELNKSINDLNLVLPLCIGSEGINTLIKTIQNRLIEKGYVTTRVIAPEQNLAKGELTLMVILGKVRRILINDSSELPKFNRWQSWTALTFSTGDLLNLRDIEQSLENLKRLPTAEANIEILPSNAKDADVGESDIQISYKQGFPLRFNLSLNDGGSKSTGKWQGSATLSWDNLLLANDLFYANFTHSMKRHTDDKGKRASKNLQLYYSIPLGYWNLAFSHGEHRYHQQVFGAFTNYIYAGKSKTDKLQISYQLYRDAKRKTSMYASLWSRHSNNYINGNEIEVQKRRMSGWELGLNHREYWKSAVIDLGFNYKKGTGARGALSAPEELWNEGTSRPVIISANLNYTHPFQMREQSFRFSTEWSAQWNKTPLIAQDRFSIGGRHTVRGFDGELTLSAERGWLARNEVAWNILQTHQWLYVGIDAGRIMGSSAALGLGNHLVGSVIGIRGEKYGFYYDFFIGRPISKPEGFRTSHSVTGFNIGYSF